MRIKFSPKKETILGLIQLTIDSLSEELVVAEKKLEAVGKFALEGSSYHMDVMRLQSRIRRETDLRTLIESHAGQFVTIEEDTSF